jgi:hypothetical protein
MPLADARSALALPRGSRRYGLVLLLTGFSLVFQMAAPDDAVFRVVSGSLQAGTLLLALHVSSVQRRHRPLMWAVALSALATLITAATQGGDAAAGLTAATNALLVALTLGTIVLGVVESLRENQAVTLQAVLGVICVYLLIGSLFSYVYGTIAEFGDQPFFAQGTDGDHQDQLYFSFVTQTTVGYGDFTAAGRLGRSLAAIEALLGQIYLVTVVAVMVSNLRPGARPRPGGSGEPEA